MASHHLGRFRKPVDVVAHPAHDAVGRGSSTSTLMFHSVGPWYLGASLP
ncbi:hypothetical protein ACFQZC_08280 [Streptacidiphilus monticola]